MATIQASIKLHDGMTPALKSMQNALHIVINSFENMQRTTGKGVNTKAIQAARNELAKARVGFNNIEKEIKENTSAQNKFNKSVQNGTSATNGLWNKIKGIGAAYLGFQAMKQVAGVAINTSDQLTQTTARLNMINDGLQTTKELEEMIYQSAQRSRAGFMDTADAVAKLGLRAGDIFKSNAETVQFAETLNKMFVIAGASQAEMSSATLQLTQALGSGVLRGEEFNAIFEAAPNIMQEVANSMGVPIGQLRNLAGEGKITADIVKKALLGATQKVNEQFESMPMTWAQVWTSIKNYTIKATRPILDAISKITQSERFLGFVNNVKNYMAILAAVMSEVFNWVQKIAAFFYDNWSMIAPIVWGVVAAFVALKTPMMLSAIWAGICAVKTGILTGAKILATFATWAFTSATLAQAGAQWGLNAAMYACPLTWIIIAIIAVIAVIYLAVAAINHFAGTSYSATGFIAGLFMALGAVIWNMIAYSWNCFASFAEFLYNLFIDPVYATKKLFVNLATALLDLCISMTKGWDEMATNFVNAMIDAVNGVLKGWNWLVDKLGVVGEALGLGKATMFEHRTSITSDLENAKSKLQDYLGEQPKNYWEAPKMEYKSVGDSYNKGYDWGSNLVDKVKNFGSTKDTGAENYLDKLNKTLKTDPLSLAKGDPLDNIGKSLGSGSNPALDKISGDVSDIASNTSDIAADDENLDLMRDLAEREAINRYTLTDLKVEMTNNNNVNSALDLDDIVKHLSKKVYEGILASADGLHF